MIIIPGQSGTYRHSRRRVTGLLADSGLMAYGKLYSNAGAMTPGVTGETVDGMSLAKIDAIIGALRAESYRWSPARRVYIPKKGSRVKKRPLGMPPWAGKIVAGGGRTIPDADSGLRVSD